MPDPLRRPAPSDRDSETIRLLRSRDPAGLQRLLADHGPRVRGVLEREFRGLPATDLDEAFNLAAMLAWERARRYDRQRGSLRTWFCVITRSAARAIRRRELRAQTNLEIHEVEQVTTAPPAAEPDPEPVLFLDDLHECIEGLTRMQRAIVQADLRSQDIADGASLAAELGTTQNSVYAARSMARKALRACLLSKGHPFSDDPARSDLRLQGED